MTAILSRIDRQLPMGTKRRRLAATAASVAVVAAVTQFMLPRATPSGVLLRGIVIGCSNALLAAGLVLVYRSSRVINFAQAAMGGAAAYLLFDLGTLLRWPFAVALPLAVLAGAAVGALVNGLVVQRFFDAPRLVLTVATIVLSSLLAGAGSWLDRIGAIHSARTNLVNATVVSEGRVRVPFQSWTFRVEPFTFGVPAVLALSLTALALAGLALFLRRSRLGTSVRAAAENADRALMLGVNVRLLSAVVWTLAGTLSGVALLLRATNDGLSGVGSIGPELIIVPLAAAVIGRMDDIPTTVVAALVISAAQQAAFWSYPRTSALDVALLLVIAAGLLLQRRRAGRSEDGPAASWEATRELRPVPKELDVVPGVRRSLRAVAVVALIAVVVLPFATSTSQTNLGGLIFIQAIVAVSLVVLTGWAGQVSLGQFALVAVAAVVGAHLTADLHVNFFLALPLVAALTGGFAALVGLPALRIPGSFLAVTTLAFAVAVQQTLFGTAVFRRLIPDRVDRPHLFFVSFAGERSYYFLCLFFLVLCALVVVQLRRSRPGRVLIALRDNESGVQSLGINLVRTRLVAFALSGALCGIAGILYVHHQRAVDPASYGAIVSIEIFVMAMIGGITSVPGALLGAAYIGISRFVFTSPLTRELVGDGGLLVLLYVAPGGLAAVAASVRDAGLRIVALRRRIVVPSLFEDLDPEALLSRRQPLAERIPGNGLDAIPRGRRYRRASELHGARGR